MVSTGWYSIYPQTIGAIEPYVRQLSKELSYKNYVDLLGLGKGKKEGRNLNIQTFRLSEIGILNKILGYNLSHQILFNASILKRIVSLHRISPIDVLHIHDAYSGFAASICKLGLQIPIVCSIHNEIRTAASIRICDRVLAVSEYLKNFLCEKRKLQRVDILPDAIDYDLYKPVKNIEQAKKELGLIDNKIILFVGRKCPEKGPKVLIEAIPEIVKRNPKTKVVFIGPDYSFGSLATSYSAFLIRKAKKLGVQEHTIFQGLIPESTLRNYYEAADVFVCPSVWQEPFGMVLLEALAYEKPVVASDVGGIPEIIKDKVNGLLVTPNNPNQIANAVTSLLENTEFASILGKSGRKIVQEKYNFKAVGKRCLEIYEDILLKN
jgi:glycosyltransferase involved in cell wall biosynthesis